MQDQKTRSVISGTGIILIAKISATQLYYYHIYISPNVACTHGLSLWLLNNAKKVSLHLHGILNYNVTPTQCISKLPALTCCFYTATVNCWYYHPLQLFIRAEPLYSYVSC
jgi:hypothetical protein